LEGGGKRQRWQSAGTNYCGPGRTGEVGGSPGPHNKRRHNAAMLPIATFPSVLQSVQRNDSSGPGRHTVKQQTRVGEVHRHAANSLPPPPKKKRKGKGNKPPPEEPPEEKSLPSQQPSAPPRPSPK
jgi:hypothetical protein